MSTLTPDNNAAAGAAPQGTTETPVPASQPVPQDTALEAIAAKLAGIAAAEEAEAAPAAQPDPAPPTPEAEKPPEQPPEEPAKGTEEPEAAKPPEAEPPKMPELPSVRHPHAREDDPTVDDVDPKFTKIRSRFEKQTALLHEAREAGKYGIEIQEFAKANGIKPEDVAALLRESVNLRKGDKETLKAVAAQLQQHGVKLAEDPRAADLAEKLYQERFAASVEAKQITPSYARKLADDAARQQLQAVEAQVQPPANPPGVNIDAGLNAVAALDAQIAESYRKAGVDYSKVRESAYDALTAKVREGRLKPEYFAYEFRQAVATAQASARPVAPKPINPSPSLKPSTHVPAEKPPATEDEALARVAAKLANQRLL